MKETEIKTKMVKKMREEGGYGRRFEDQYAVGLPDTVLIPRGGPTFFCEVKIIRGKWAPTPRQFEELKRIHESRGAVPVLVGYEPDMGYLLAESPCATLRTWSIKTDPKRWNLVNMLSSYLAQYERTKHEW